MNNSRQLILNAVKKNKPAHEALPEVPVFGNTSLDLTADFKTVIEKIGGTLHRVVDHRALKSFLEEAAKEYQQPVCVEPDWLNTERKANADTDPHALADVDLAIIKGTLGVAENASIWITEEAMGNRALPFVTQHLIIVLNASDMVYNMHEAYQIIEVPRAGYGVFIAGPSKTADIEQSLVIGAHGPKSLRVVLVG